MQPKSKRRVHGAEFKTQVLAECQQPGASVAAIALSHGLNVNLLRKWLVGRGIQRTGLDAPRAVTRTAAGTDETLARSLQFIPVEIASAPVAATAMATAPEQAQPPGAEIRVELTRGATQLSVRWPSAQAAACAAWLRELATVALKD
ncbi:MAG: transposase [Burkholderiales bacterium]|nr:transposase [Burkholderiales bacterium]